MTTITLHQANTVITAALAKGVELGLKPLSAVVLDPGGHLLAFQRQDGALKLGPQVATAKASGALMLGVSSRKLAEMAVERPNLVASLGPISPHGVVPAAGGVIMIDENGVAIGAVGVTGGSSDNDEICAFAGIAAAGLVAQT